MTEQLYQCPVCKLHYHDKSLAKQCEAFCRKFHGCSLEITQQSIEHQQFLAQRKKDINEN
jgi:hypothetical protein